MWNSHEFLDSGSKYLHRPAFNASIRKKFTHVSSFVQIGSSECTCNVVNTMTTRALVWTLDIKQNNNPFLPCALKKYICYSNDNLSTTLNTVSKCAQKLTDEETQKCRTQISSEWSTFATLKGSDKPIPKPLPATINYFKNKLWYLHVSHQYS